MRLTRSICSKLIRERAGIVKAMVFLIIPCVSLALAASAIAAPQAPQITGSPLCAASGHSLCLSDTGNIGPGNTISTQHKLVGPNQNIALVLNTEVCNHGITTNRCPFTLGSGNNTIFEGKSVYRLKFTADSDTCAATTDVTVLTAVCNTNGTDWVAVDQAVGVEQLVNVYATNNDSSNRNDPEYLDSTELVGNQAVVNPTSDQGPSNWAH